MCDFKELFISFAGFIVLLFVCLFFFVWVFLTQCCLTEVKQKVASLKVNISRNRRMFTVHRWQVLTSCSDCLRCDVSDLSHRGPRPSLAPLPVTRASLHRCRMERKVDHHQKSLTASRCCFQGKRERKWGSAERGPLIFLLLAVTYDTSAGSSTS